MKPGDLRRVGLYGGAQGIWVDKQKTVSDSFSDGIAVSVLHTDSAIRMRFQREVHGTTIPRLIGLTAGMLERSGRSRTAKSPACHYCS